MDKLKTSWDLTPLFNSDGDPSIATKRKGVIRETEKFVGKWKKRKDYLKDPRILEKALDEYEYWAKHYANLGQEVYYFSLRTSLDQNDPSLKAKENKADELSKKIQNDIQFFELNIAKIDTKLQNKFLSYKPLYPYKHFLEKLFIQSKYLLSEPEEKIMNLKSTVSHENWVKMLSGFLAKEERKVLDKDKKSKTKNFSEILSLLSDKDKKVRDDSAKAFNEILKKHLDVAEHELNSILLNKKINDELRDYERPDKARHVSDDIDTQVVDALVKAVTGNFEVPKRYYKLKAKLMGVSKLAYHERNVEYAKVDNKEYKFDESYELISKVLTNLDAKFFQIFENFVKKGQVDVYSKKNKVSGAFCIYGLITHPVYILLNWTNKLQDVLTFAHELGHGINDELVKSSQNSLNFGTPTSTAEVASTFMEDFVLQELLEKADDELKLSLMMMKLNEDINSIHRQVAFYNFERELHKEFRSVGYLSKETIGKLFASHMESYMGYYVEQSDGSENWWVYVGHFRYFFYVYSYASGLLISKSLQASVKKDPKFIEKVKEFLSAGLSDSPKNIFENLGIDITNKKFWERGLSEIEVLLQETESLAKKLKLLAL